jgi:uncharacterized damage-inducible protein DinB
MSDMWLPEGEDPRTYGNPQGELATYREYLTNYRTTLALKCADLDPAQLATRSVPPSTMSLLGMVRHLAAVENGWFHKVLAQNPEAPRLYRRADDRDADWNDAVGEQDVVDEAFAAWRREIEAADSWLDTRDDAGLGEEVPLGDGIVSVRDVLVHMIEEYARHCGHADLLRECIDGRTGQ